MHDSHCLCGFYEAPRFWDKTIGLCSLSLAYARAQPSVTQEHLQEGRGNVWEGTVLSVRAPSLPEVSSNPRDHQI